VGPIGATGPTGPTGTSTAFYTTGTGDIPTTDASLVTLTIPPANGGDYVVNAKAWFKYTGTAKTGMCTLAGDGTNSDTVTVAKATPAATDSDAVAAQTIAHLPSGGTITLTCSDGTGGGTWSNVRVTAIQVSSLVTG
jgi:hypothetical protein